MSNFEERFTIDAFFTVGLHRYDDVQPFLMFSSPPNFPPFPGYCDGRRRLKSGEDMLGCFQGVWLLKLCICAIPFDIGRFGVWLCGVSTASIWMENDGEVLFGWAVCYVKDSRLISAKSEVSYYDMSKFRNEHNVKMQPGTASLIPIV
ncbi:hypothetical protein EYC84_007726 [Monilinia fructicola]|uniref:Uncharacterized protein n=1 Tax=Monilinia fructicola TaxID=38448 RepID=A0A5M9JL73_MONFR|nr:hypothetical protein EYC84_007726 [Monilinia fructicola]